MSDIITDDHVHSPLLAARRARAADTHARAKKALRDVIASQEPVTFPSSA